MKNEHKIIKNETVLMLIPLLSRLEHKRLAILTMNAITLHLFTQLKV